jgi:outer membrane protein TolC
MAKFQSNYGKSGIDSKKVESSLSAKINNVERKLNDLKVSYERKSYYPEISLGLGVSRSYGDDGTTSPINKSAVISVNLPLFSRFSTESAIASYTKLAASQNDLAEAELVRSHIKLEAALRDFNRLSARLIESNSPTKMALEIMEKSRLRFLEGKISANELSTDESRYLSLLDSLLRDYQLIHQDLVTICEESSEEWSTCLNSF